MKNMATPHDHDFDLPTVRSVSLGRPLTWLRAGWRDMWANPIVSLTYGLLFAIAGGFVLTFSWRSPHFFAAAVSGLLLIGPLLASGLYEISRRQDSGLHSTFSESIAGWRRNGRSMAMLGVLLAIITFSWACFSVLLFGMLIPDMAPGLSAFVSNVLLNAECRVLTAIWLFAGGCLALFVFSLTVISAPMLVDRDVDFVAAMMTSVRAVADNLNTMLLWCATIAALTLLGFATLFCGLIIVMPLLGHASWHAYRDLVE